MNKGITVNGLHSYLRFGMKLLKRAIGSASKDDYTERVPFSSVTHDFSRIYGDPAYSERTLTYTFEFIEFRNDVAEERLTAVLEWLHFSGRQSLWDDMLPNHHFEVREPAVSWSEKHGVYNITASFRANPAMKPNPNLLYSAETVNFPDINGDGIITSVDASMILDAVADITAGEDTELTPAQLRACDANMDGKITGADATLVLNFYSAVQEGKYQGDIAGWVAYINDYFGMDKGVI